MKLDYLSTSLIQTKLSKPFVFVFFLASQNVSLMKTNSFLPVDTDEVERRPNERNEEQKQPRGPSSVSFGWIPWESDAEGCVCVCVWVPAFICSVVSGLRGLPEDPDKCFNGPCQHGFVLPSTTSVYSNTDAQSLIGEAGGGGCWDGDGGQASGCKEKAVELCCNDQWTKHTWKTLLCV